MPPKCSQVEEVMVFRDKIEQEEALLVKQMAQICDATVHGEHMLFQLQTLGSSALETFHLIHNLTPRPAPSGQSLASSEDRHL